ncbi:MAG: B12-binding domain-containing radical SAM protein [Candidatus Bathyarchaeota archaeon]|nr:B12-binding domain-containing radical SAM protein [Candidatus Bathyarchaeum sp.]
MQKILLINPFHSTKYPQPPLGLAMIGAVLLKNGYDIDVLDLPALGLSEKVISSTVAKEQPDVVGITALTPEIDSAIKTAEIVKASNSDIPVVLGGAHGTILPEETLRNTSAIDVVVRGEGEQTMLELVKVFGANQMSGLKDVSGITYRSGNIIKSNPERMPILDLDSLPYPAFDLLLMDKYRLHPPFGRRSPAMPIITSRGCPYRCIFCSKSVFGRKYCGNSADYVIAEIQLLIEKFGIKEIKFYDDVFTLDKKRIVALCNKMKELGLDIPWTCETRVNLVNSRLLNLMKESGCYMIEYGIESGNQTILNNLRKDITLNQIVDAFKNTKAAGIDTVAYFMIGAPGETPNTIRDTIEFAKKIDPDFVQFSLTTPYPGTDLYDLAVKDGYVPTEWKKYVYADLKSMDYPTFKTATLSPEELRKWNKKAYSSFYFRGAYLWKRIKKLGSITDMKTNVAGLRMLIDLVK